MPQTALQTPFDTADAVPVGAKLFRKQVLPVGSIEYQGQKLEFTPEYLKRLADNFAQGTYDQVPFLLADDQNRHTDNPERFRGEIKGLEATSDGLYATVELSDDGAKLVKDNPKLGVSARIMQGLSRGGQVVGDAVAHVLGTLDPKVQGLKAWEAVDLSNADTTADMTVIDLTANPVTVPQVTPQPDPNAPAAPLSDDEAGLLKRLAARLKSVGGKSPADSATVTDADLDTALAHIAAEPVPAPAASLSEEDRKAIELATQRATDAEASARASRVELARQKFEGRKAQYVAAGVPPNMIAAAEQLLLNADVPVIELSNGSKVDPADVVQKMLDEAEGTIDLTERGHTVPRVDLSGDGQADDETTRLVKQWGVQFDG